MNAKKTIAWTNRRNVTVQMYSDEVCLLSLADFLNTVPLTRVYMKVMKFIKNLLCFEVI